MNTFGTLYRLTSFGESHGAAMGGVIDGVPAGMPLDLPAIQSELDRRRPGQSDLTTPRKEPDTVQFLSGLQGGITLGSPIGFTVPNTNAKPQDYQSLRTTFRPGHADYTYQKKYGLLAASGGGRASARETVSRVVSGAIAKQFLRAWYDVQVHAHITHIAGETDPTAQANAIRQAKTDGDSVGGVIECTTTPLPVGWGSPVFDRLEADITKALMSLPATKGVEIGAGFAAATMRGSDHNDELHATSTGVHFASNNAGGVLGGISSGQPLVVRVAFKPVSTVQVPQHTLTHTEENTILENPGGRHDPCVVPRALPLVEAMVAHTLFDHALRARAVAPLIPRP